MFSFDIIPPCTKCQYPRVEHTIDQVSAGRRLTVEEMCKKLKASGTPVRQIAYCKKCDEYGYLHDWAAF